MFVKFCFLFCCCKRVKSLGTVEKENKYFSRIIDKIRLQRWYKRKKCVYFNKINWILKSTIKHKGCRIRRIFAVEGFVFGITVLYTSPVICFSWISPGYLAPPSSETLFPPKYPFNLVKRWKSKDSRSGE